MSDCITGTHLCSENLNDEAEKELERFGKWVEAGDFQALTDEIHKCKDKDRERKLEPVLKALHYKVRNPSGSCSKAFFASLKTMLIYSSISSFKYFAWYRELI
jgi:hypothetical protein